MNIKAPSTIENKGPLSAAGGVVLDAPPEHESFDEKIARLKEQLKSVPTLPGVYLWKDASGQVIYVGKAKQLRARMKQYVMGQDERAKIPMMLEQVSTFEYVVVNNEHESLVLEKNLSTSSRLSSTPTSKTIKAIRSSRLRKAIFSPLLSTRAKNT